MSNSDLQCMYPSCSINCYARGLCKPHYMVAFRLVKYGAATWKQLAKNGKCTSKRSEHLTGAEEWFLSDNNHQ